MHAMANRYLECVIRNDDETTSTTMHTIFKKNINKIKMLCLNHNIKSLFAFGSVCSDELNNSSDIDLLFSFNPMDYTDNYFLVADKLKAFANS